MSTNEVWSACPKSGKHGKEGGGGHLRNGQEVQLQAHEGDHQTSGELLPSSGSHLRGRCDSQQPCGRLAHRQCFHILFLVGLPIGQGHRLQEPASPLCSKRSGHAVNSAEPA
eukprot:GHVL01020084.1.p3 GENE.GHVL01020084.1~~GHVL01020084.1.p3  ORF type:complete len:112 (-),score=6.94 GHVL01020084.1:602-937(-)